MYFSPHFTAASDAILIDGIDHLDFSFYVLHTDGRHYTK